MLNVRKTLFGTSVKGVKIITRGEKTGLPSKHNKGRIRSPRAECLCGQRGHGVENYIKAS